MLSISHLNCIELKGIKSGVTQQSTNKQFSVNTIKLYRFTCDHYGKLNATPACTLRLSTISLRAAPGFALFYSQHQNVNHTSFYQTGFVSRLQHIPWSSTNIQCRRHITSAPTTFTKLLNHIILQGISILIFRWSLQLKVYNRLMLFCAILFNWTFKVEYQLARSHPQLMPFRSTMYNRS